MPVKRAQLPKTSRSLWIATAPFPRFPPLQGDLAVDVAIVAQDLRPGSEP